MYDNSPKADYWPKLYVDHSSLQWTSFVYFIGKAEKLICEENSYFDEKDSHEGTENYLYNETKGNFPLNNTFAYFVQRGKLSIYEVNTDHSQNPQGGINMRKKERRWSGEVRIRP